MRSFILSQWRDLRMGVIWEDLGALTTVRSNHEYTLSEPTAVANIAAWIHLRTFPSVEDTLPHTTRFFNTWKNSSSVNASQYSSRFTGSHHEYTLSEPTAVTNIAVWIHLKIFPSVEDTYHVPQGSSIPGKTFLPWTPVSILAVLLDHTMITYCLSQVQW